MWGGTWESAASTVQTSQGILPELRVSTASLAPCLAQFLLSLVGARAQLLCKRISWGSCYNADSDSAGLRWGRESLTYPVRMKKLLVQGPHCRRQQRRSQAPGIGRRMPRQACRAQGRHAGAGGAPVGFWREQEVRKNCAFVGCWGAADTRWCEQQKPRARWGEAMCLLSLPRVMLPGGGVQRTGGWRGAGLGLRRLSWWFIHRVRWQS